MAEDTGDVEPAGESNKNSLPIPMDTHRYYPACQEPFMPNSTPFVQNYRYLAWNSIGYVTCRQDDSKSKIDVEFFESEKYRPIRFIDSDGFSMASIGPKGVLLASEFFDDKNLSVVKFIPFESWAANSDWSYVLPNGESVSLISMAKRFAVLYFDSNQIAIYSLNGILKVEFKWPCHKAISMTSFENELFLLWIGDGGNTMFTLFDLETLQIVHSGVLCVRPENSNQILWIGYSETGMPLCYFDSGCLYGLLHNCFFSWVLLLDCNQFRSPKNENFWPISVTFDNILLYVACYSGEKYPNPSVKTRTVSELPLKPSPTIPLNESESGVLLLQTMSNYHTIPETLVLDEERQSHLDNFDYLLDKQLLDLILTALNTNRQAKAIELVTSLTLQVSYQKAIRLCQHLKLYDLADKVDMLRERTFNKQQKHQPLSEENSQADLFDSNSNYSALENTYNTKLEERRNMAGMDVHKAPESPIPSSITSSLLKSPVKAFLANLPNEQGKASEFPASPVSNHVPKPKNPFFK